MPAPSDRPALGGPELLRKLRLRIERQDPVTAFDVIVLGAGPVGIEAAVRSAADGHRTLLVEAGEIAANVRAWEHIRMFTPWSMNTTARGRELAETLTGETLPPDECPTGDELIERYLRPMLFAAADAMPDRLTVLTRCAIAPPHRIGWPKAAGVGRDGRATAWFGVRLGDGFLVEDDPFCFGGSGHWLREAEKPHRSEAASVRSRVLIDATGTRAFGDDSQGWPGPLNPVLPTEWSDNAFSWFQQGLLEANRGWQRALVIGGGASAATDLLTLHRGGCETTVLTRSDRMPFEPLADDPLPNRAKLYREARGLIKSGAVAWIGGVRSFGIEFILPDGSPSAVVDEIPTATSRLRLVDVVGVRDEVPIAGYDDAFDVAINDTGRVPDLDLIRELQVHLCYATEGPMRLAAHLMGQDAAAGDGPVDCLAQTGSDADLLRTTEPGFFMLGAKSYGRRSNFLLRAGLEQVEATFDTLVPEHLGRCEPTRVGS